MNRSSGPRKTANLSKSTNQQLTMYALAASAAGVGVLALSQPVQGKIIYTHANVTIDRSTGSYALDVNHDGKADFTFDIYSVYASCCFIGTMTVAAQNKTNAVVAVHSHKRVLPTDLGPGFQIGPTLRRGIFQPGTGIMAKIRIILTSSYLLSYGLWRNVTNRYLGMKFSDLKGRIHYGWARLSVGTSGTFTATLTGYAYETIPGKSIKAGQTEGQMNDVEASPDSLSPADPVSGAYLTTPIPNTPQPASLGMLALGAPSVPLWRRKEAQEVIVQ